MVYNNQLRTAFDIPVFACDIIHLEVAVVTIINFFERLTISNYLATSLCKNSGNKLAYLHCVKTVHIWSFSGPCFPACEMNRERYSISLNIQSECRKKRTRKTLNKDTFQGHFSSSDGNSETYGN